MWTRFFHSGWWECQLAPALCDSTVILPAPSRRSFPFPWVLLLDVLIQTLVMTRGTMSPGFLLLSPWTCLFSLLCFTYFSWLGFFWLSTLPSQLRGSSGLHLGYPQPPYYGMKTLSRYYAGAVVRIILFSFWLSKITTLLLPSFLKKIFPPTHFVQLF